MEQTRVLRPVRYGEFISPGKVGPVGETLLKQRLRTSHADMAPVYDISTASLVWNGSNVQDGHTGSFRSGGMGAKTLDNNAFTNPQIVQIGETFHGTRFQFEHDHPRQIARPRDSWNNHVKQVYTAKMVGDQFLPLPGGYERTGVPRGTGPHHVVIENPEFLYVNEDIASPNFGGVPSNTPGDGTSPKQPPPIFGGTGANPQCRLI